MAKVEFKTPAERRIGESIDIPALLKKSSQIYHITRPLLFPIRIKIFEIINEINKTKERGAYLGEICTYTERKHGTIQRHLPRLEAFGYIESVGFRRSVKLTEHGEIVFNHYIRTINKWNLDILTEANLLSTNSPNIYTVLKLVSLGIRAGKPMNLSEIFGSIFGMENVKNGRVVRDSLLESEIIKLKPGDKRTIHDSKSMNFFLTKKGRKTLYCLEQLHQQWTRKGIDFPTSIR
jgi:DNA-binding MarR family transcriptional regulator|tara:strand:- start:206 stop:910 length:705 start_codon:yes stop_codon:yes gene_type:complete